MNTTSTNTASVISQSAELAAQKNRDILKLAEELGHGRGLRIAAVADILESGDFTACDVEDAAYQIRSEVYELFGHTVSDADDDESGGGIPAIESCIRLQRDYGRSWVQHAYTDYLISWAELSWERAAVEAGELAASVFGDYEARTRKVVEVKRYRVAA